MLPTHSHLLFSSINKHSLFRFFLSKVPLPFLLPSSDPFPADLCWILKCGPYPNPASVLKCQRCCAQRSPALLGLPACVRPARRDVWVFRCTTRLCLVNRSASRETATSCWSLSQVSGWWFSYWVFTFAFAG